GNPEKGEGLGRKVVDIAGEGKCWTCIFTNLRLWEFRYPVQRSDPLPSAFPVGRRRADGLGFRSFGLDQEPQLPALHVRQPNQAITPRIIPTSLSRFPTIRNHPHQLPCSIN